MWKIQFRGTEDGKRRAVFVFDETDALRWSGPNILDAYRYLAEWGQTETAIDVDSAIWYLSPDDAP